MEREKCLIPSVVSLHVRPVEDHDNPKPNLVYSDQNPSRKLAYSLVRIYNTGFNKPRNNKLQSISIDSSSTNHNISNSSNINSNTLPPYVSGFNSHHQNNSNNNNNNSIASLSSSILNCKFNNIFRKNVHNQIHQTSSSESFRSSQASTPFRQFKSYRYHHHRKPSNTPPLQNSNQNINGNNNYIYNQITTDSGSTSSSCNSTNTVLPFPSKNLKRQDIEIQQLPSNKSEISLTSDDPDSSSDKQPTLSYCYSSANNNNTNSSTPNNQTSSTSLSRPRKSQFTNFNSSTNQTSSLQNSNVTTSLPPPPGLLEPIRERPISSTCALSEIHAQTSPAILKRSKSNCTRSASMVNNTTPTNITPTNNSKSSNSNNISKSKSIVAASSGGYSRTSSSQNNYVANQDTFPYPNPMLPKIPTQSSSNATLSSAAVVDLMVGFASRLSELDCYVIETIKYEQRATNNKYPSSSTNIASSSVNLSTTGGIVNAAGFAATTTASSNKRKSKYSLAVTAD